MRQQYHKNDFLILLGISFLAKKLFTVNRIFFLQPLKDPLFPRRSRGAQ